MGYDNNNIDTSIAMLRYIDAYVGLPSILYDTDNERRSLYGKAGCFRLQPYGFEYRTLSSYWIATEARLKFIWKQVEYALYNFECSNYLPDSAYVVKAINDNDVALAKKLIEKFDLIRPNNKPE